jgi:benzoylformate decarboxylase
VADPRLGLQALTEAVRRRMSPERKRACETRRERVAAARALWSRMEADRAAQDWNATPIRHWRLVKEMKAVLRDDIVLVNEATTAKTYVNALFPVARPEDYFEHSSAYLGWGIGAASGVALARPGRHVVLAIGDGCFNFGLQGLWSVARYRLPILMIVFNNRGYISTKSRLHNLEGLAARERTYFGSDLDNPAVDYVQAGLSVGIPGLRVERPDELRSALEWGVAQQGAAILDVLLDPRETGWYTPPMP